MQRNIYHTNEAYRGGFLLDLSPLVYAPPRDLSPYPIFLFLYLPIPFSPSLSFLRPSFSLSLSLSLSPSLSTPSSFAPWMQSVSAFIDRSQNDLAHVSYSSWRSGVGGLDFSLPAALSCNFLFFSSRRDATQLNSMRTASLHRRDAPRSLPVVDSPPMYVSLTSWMSYE